MRSRPVSIAVEDFHKIYDKTVAVQGLTFRVEPGEILGLVGPNGAGKTTTMRALAGILNPSRGRLSIDGHDLASNPAAAKQALSYVPDDPHLFENLTIWEHFEFVAATYRVGPEWVERGEKLLEQFELVDKKNSPTATLSRGMRQKVAISCGYLHNPKVIMLDEPLTGLDPRGIRTMNESIRSRAAAGSAVMISSHLLTLVEDLCTSILVMYKGKMLLKGTLDELRQNLRADGRTETLEDLYFRLTEGSEYEGVDLPEIAPDVDAGLPPIDSNQAGA
jgi:ABC-2 type transport system ATP-binding protein